MATEYKPRIEKVDLRRLKRREVMAIDGNIYEQVHRELERFGVKIIGENPWNNEITFKGKRNIKIGGSERTEHYTETWNVGTFIKLARQYEKNAARINKIRQKHDVSSYEQRPLEELLRESSEGKERTGLRNYIETQKKILKRDGGVNKVERAGKAADELREIKARAFEDSDRFMHIARVDVGKYKNKLKNGKYGAFKSEKAKREYYKLFSKLILEEFELYENAFFGYLGEHLDTSERTVKDQYLDMTMEEKIEKMREYLLERGASLSEGSEERYAVALDDEDIADIMHELKAKGG